MKKLITSLLLVSTILVINTAYADFFVYYDKDTNEIQFIINEGEERRLRLSEEDKTRLKKKKLNGKISDYDLVESLQDYKLIGRNFIVNTQKISDRVNDGIAEEARQAQVVLDLESAKTKLMALGLTEAEFNALLE